MAERAGTACGLQLSRPVTLWSLLAISFAQFSPSCPQTLKLSLVGVAPMLHATEEALITVAMTESHFLTLHIHWLTCFVVYASPCFYSK